jgi:hypothetical protein
MKIMKGKYAYCKDILVVVAALAFAEWRWQSKEKTFFVSAIYRGDGL